MFSATAKARYSLMGMYSVIRDLDVAPALQAPYNNFDGWENT